MGNILELKDLKTYFYTRRGLVKAVDGVSFSVDKGETFGIVGESGSGKSITCMSIVRLVPYPAGRIVSGKIFLNGVDLLSKSEREMRQIRGRQITMILQDPMTSLNPVFTIGDQVAEPIKIHQKVGRRLIKQKIINILKRVNIASPEIRMKDYPHQMSGGMRQRVVGAIALSCQPELIIADEPTTALDVTIQSQFLKLFKDIQQEYNLSMIIVTHDLGIVAKVCDRVAVMYAGRILECAKTEDLFSHPAHPYTRALLDSLPKLDEERSRLCAINGQPPSLSNLPPGCSFAPRCSQAFDICSKEYPAMSCVADGHTVSCWLVD